MGDEQPLKDAERIIRSQVKNFNSGTPNPLDGTWPDKAVLRIVAYALREDRKRRDSLDCELASAADLANSWARECHIDECEPNAKSLKELIDRLWAWTSERIHRDSLEADLVALGEACRQGDEKVGYRWTRRGLEIGFCFGDGRLSADWHDTPRAAVKAAMKEVKP